MQERDDLPTLIAIGLLAYASADIAHHALGHGGMCLALGGRILSLSSIYVDCTVRGAAIDLAGPFANLIVGVLALAAAVPAQRTARLFLALAAAFNLSWFGLQLSFSAATRSDDFAWAMTVFHVGAPMCYLLLATGLAFCWLAIRVAARLFAPFGQLRVRRIVWIAWLTAGGFACITALWDRDPLSAILYHAAPQSFALSVGILFLPRSVGGKSEGAAPIRFGVSWIASALAVAIASILFLGPGFSV